MTSTIGVKKIQYPNGTDILTLDSSGSIAIGAAATISGTLTVNDPIQILNGSNVNDASTDADDLIIEGPNDCGLSILSATTGRIFFGDAADNDVGSIRYIHTDNSMRFETNAGERMRIDGSGNVGVNNTNPDQYVTTGKVVAIQGTANNSGSASLHMNGNTDGSGYYNTQVFAVSGITSATEITRYTGTGANGFRAYFKIIATGHTGSVNNGINIKEYWYDGSTGNPVQISSYTATSAPVIAFDNSTSNVLIVTLSSSDGTNGFNGVVKIEALIPVDFGSSTWTIS